MSEGLKRCPFCGGKATLLHPEAGEDDSDYVIGCYNKCCGFSYERARSKSKQEVINAWNTRDSFLKKIMRWIFPSRELQPCPSCGGRSRLFSYYTGRFYYGVKCTKCDKVICDCYPTKEKAIYYWNSRVRRVKNE